MKLIYSQKEARRQRKRHITILKELGQLTDFDKMPSKASMIVRVNVLQNYMMNFSVYFKEYYALKNKFQRWRLRRILGKKRLQKLLNPKKARDVITIDEVFKLFRKLNLKKEFSLYFISKTHMSYTVFKEHKIPAVVNPIDFVKKEKALSLKVSQFIYCILSEYIILHNLMFASRYKIEGIKTIDRWLTKI